MTAFGLLAFGRRAVRAQQPDADAGLLNEVFKGRPVADGSRLIAIDMPARAEDAAIVPVTMRATLAPGDGRKVRAFTLIVDQNPAPVAATFALGDAAGVTSIATRVRVEGYTNVHAVAELSDGRLYAVKTFVKASGGCSAPALKTVDEAQTRIGELKFRRFTPTDEAAPQREAQIMVRHPNYSGMQMDPLSRLYTPALFVHALLLWQGEALVLAMDGGLSILRESERSLQLSPERRQQLSRRNRRHQRPGVSRRVAGRRSADVTARGNRDPATRCRLIVRNSEPPPPPGRAATR